MRIYTQSSVLCLLLAILAIAGSVCFAAPKVDFIARQWLLKHATDEEGTSWAGSTLKFTSEKKVATGFRLSGYFIWRHDGIVAGRENFIGTYTTKTRSFRMEGRSKETSSNTVLATYSAVLSRDGHSLIQGTWTSNPRDRIAVPGHWTADSTKR